MNREQFLQLLRNLNIDESIICFDNSLKDGYCVRKNHLRWEVFLRERGSEYEVKGYPSESDALISLSDKLISIYLSDYYRMDSDRCKGEL